MDPCTLVNLVPAPGSPAIAEYGDKLVLKHGIEAHAKPRKKKKKKSVHFKAAVGSNFI